MLIVLSPHCVAGISGPDFYHSAASFRMLRHVCAEQVEQFDWFVFAVDDSYIKARELFALLSTLNKDEQVSGQQLQSPTGLFGCGCCYIC